MTDKEKIMYLISYVSELNKYLRCHDGLNFIGREERSKIRKEIADMTKYIGELSIVEYADAE